MIRGLAILAATLVLGLCRPQIVIAAGEDSDVSMEQAEVSESDEGAETSSDESSSDESNVEDSGLEVRYIPYCNQKSWSEVCLENTHGCLLESGEMGVPYVKLVRRAGTNEAWRDVDVLCFGEAELRSLGTITPDLVATEFRKLEWPKAELLVEPPDGETLVNFPTNFYTENTEPTTQQVTLLGTRITIEATPTSYTWYFGDGDVLDSTAPGQPAPDPKVVEYTPEELEASPLFVSHRYLDAHVTEDPAVDVTYTGRYRIGAGPWTDIPDSHTVEGDTIPLRIIEGIPRLVG